MSGLYILKDFGVSLLEFKDNYPRKQEKSGLTGNKCP
jgi:hypothetical protein